MNRPGIFITYRRLRTEVLWLALSLVVACGLNVYAIIHYGAPWTELLTSVLYVLMATAVVYLILLLLRLIVWGLRRLIVKS